MKSLALKLTRQKREKKKREKKTTLRSLAPSRMITHRDLDILLSSPVYNVSFEIAFNQFRLMGTKHEIAEDYVHEIFRSWIFSINLQGQREWRNTVRLI